MQFETFLLGGVPAALWGPPAESVLVAVHGNLSHKADTVIGLLAAHAVPRGWQVLSFDLPGHGARRQAGAVCKAQDAIPEVAAAVAYARARWRKVGLFGCSMGAYFTLLACADEPLRQGLFLSPVVDMQKLAEGMMAGVGATPTRLEAEGEIATPFGETLYWDTYAYVRAHPVTRWDTPTAVLCGERDAISPGDAVAAFATRFGCALDVMPAGEHFFHTPEQLAYYEQWLEARIERQ